MWEVRTDENGLPCISGSTDSEDSAMFIGLLSVFEWPSMKLDFTPYFDLNLMYRRCVDSKYSFSRDQTIPFVAGLSKSRLNKMISLDRVNGKDFFSPSDRGHIKRCQGGKASFFQDAWFWAELYFSAKHKPLDELNQLFAKMMVADKKFMRWYCKANSQWKTALELYWWRDSGAWRMEKDFCEFIIPQIEKEIL